MTIFLYLSGYALFLVFMHCDISKDAKRADRLYYLLAATFGLVWFLVIWVMLFRAGQEKWGERNG